MGYKLKVSETIGKRDTSLRKKSPLLPDVSIPRTTPMRMPNPDDPKDLICEQMTDFANFQRVIFYIDRIENGEPVWYPDRLLLMPPGLVKHLTIDR